MTTFTKATPIEDDLLLWEAEPRYCREKGTFIGTAASGTVNWPVGTVLEAASANFKPIVAGQVDPVRILLEPLTVVDNATVANVAMLARGPALVNQNQLKINGLVALEAGMIAPLLALGIKLVSEPTNQTVQAT